MLLLPAMRRAALVVASLTACSSPTPLAPPNASDHDDASLPPSSESDASTQKTDGAPAPDASTDGATTCLRSPAAADRARKVVISHPFGQSVGEKATAFEVLDLSEDGALTRPITPVTFSMGTALETPIVFTPDGEIGIVAQDDGSLGVVRIPATGVPQVIHAGFKGAFYAGGVTMAADGTRAYVLDSNVEKNGGGVYEIPIGCDGKLGTATLLVTGGAAHAMALLPADPTSAVLAAGKAIDSPAGQDAHIVNLATRTRAGSVAAFGDSDAIPSSVAVMPDGKYALIADNGILAGNRIAVVALAPQMAAVSILQTPYPAAVVASPFNNAAIVLNDDSTDQIHVLSYDPSNKTAPFSIKGELAYKFGKPQIPVTASTVSRGKLKGTVLVSENLAVRQITFDSNGNAIDTAKLSVGTGNTSIVGVVGVQP